MNIAPVLVTYSTEVPERLIRSAQAHGWPLEVMLDKDGPYKGANYKFKQIIGSIPRLREKGYTHLISVDAFDTIIVGSKQHFLGQMHSLSFPILILAAETNCYPDKSLENAHPETGTRWRYVNSPFILDLRSNASALDELADIGDEDDQVHITKFYLKHHAEKALKLDSDCRFFQSMFGVPDTTFDKASFQNKETGMFPIFYHGNGRADMSWLPFNDKPTKVLIGVPTRGKTDYAQFYDHLYRIERPANTLIVPSHGQSPAQNRNTCIQFALNNQCTHVLFIDDDVMVPPDALTKLLAHDKDIACGLYLLRKYPHMPLLFDDSTENGRARWQILEDGLDGLIPVENAGLGLCLIKIEVFKAMEKPWVRLGEMTQDHWCDDVGFFNRAKAAGFKMFADLTIRAGHGATMVVWPHYENGKWSTIIDTQGAGCAMFPQITREKLEQIASEQALGFN